MTAAPTPKNRSEYQRQWRAKNKAKVRGYEKTYKDRHPDEAKAKQRRHEIKRLPKLKAYRKLYRAKNLHEVRRKAREWQQKQRLHRRKYMKQYYAENGQKMRERASLYYRNNPGKHSACTLKRRNATAQCPKNEVAIINEWMREVRSKPFARCYWCGTKVGGREIHFDHITPLAKGGTHSIGNLCASCADCNRTKHTRLIADWIVGGQSFLNL